MTEAPRPVFSPWDNPDEKPLIQFQNVSKRFGDFTAIQNLTVDIFEREFFALLGPSGCGMLTHGRTSSCPGGRARCPPWRNSTACRIACIVGRSRTRGRVRRCGAGSYL